MQLHNKTDGVIQSEPIQVPWCVFYLFYWATAGTNRNASVSVGLRTWTPVGLADWAEMTSLREWSRRYWRRGCVSISCRMKGRYSWTEDIWLMTQATVGKKWNAPQFTRNEFLVTQTLVPVSTSDPLSQWRRLLLNRSWPWFTLLSVDQSLDSFLTELGLIWSHLLQF